MPTPDQIFAVVTLLGLTIDFAIKIGEAIGVDEDGMKEIRDRVERESRDAHRTLQETD